MRKKNTRTTQDKVTTEGQRVIHVIL